MFCHRPVDADRSLAIGTDQLYRLAGSSADWAIDVDAVADFNHYYVWSRPLHDHELAVADLSAGPAYPPFLCQLPELVCV